MEIHELVQGNADWDQFRLNHKGASEAAAMLSISPKVKRTELLHMKHTGNAKVFSDWVRENILDYGHEVEALARPIVEEIIGSDLYPVTCSDGDLSASLDGLTMAEDIAFEHKQWNKTLAAHVSNGDLPDEFMPQCQQILLVTGAEKLIFVVSDGTRDNMVWMWVLPDTEWFDRIRAGWAQFAKDLAEYQPKEIAEKPAAESILRLPALAIKISGEVVASNMPAFKQAAEKFIADIKTDLKTDQDFADAEATVKFCDEAEKELELAKNAAIAQTVSIDELMRTVDNIKDQLRTKRLMLEKLVTTKKAQIKDGIIADAKVKFAEHVATLNAEIAPIKLAHKEPDFIAAAKGKRTLASLHDAVDSELANSKIAADALAKSIRAKLAWCAINAADYQFLLNDMQQIIAKPIDDFQLLVTTRIADHKKAAEAKLEAERTRIAEEERVKAEAKAKADADLALKQKQDEFNAQMQAERERAEQAAKAAVQPVEAVRQVLTSTPTPTILQSAPSTTPTLTLGKIGTRLGFSLTADFLRTLGFEPAGRERAAMLYHESDWQAICAALIAHIDHARAPQQQAA